MNGRDLEYREALGLNADDAYPNALGTCTRGGKAPIKGPQFYTSCEPPGCDLDKIDREARAARSRRERVTTGGDTDGQLAEFAEAITAADHTARTATTHQQRQAAIRYANRLRDQREAYMRAAARKAVA